MFLIEKKHSMNNPITLVLIFGDSKKNSLSPSLTITQNLIVEDSRSNDPYTKCVNCITFSEKYVTPDRVNKASF